MTWLLIVGIIALVVAVCALLVWLIGKNPTGF